jgi:glycosyltransferase involved in cell wall biosynthesis
VGLTDWPTADTPVRWSGWKSDRAGLAAGGRERDGCSARGIDKNAAMLEAKKASPFVSIVTPVFNGERYLAECIESVLEQTFTDWEYVVVDNQSVDATPRIVERYARADPRIRLHVSDVFRPVIANWNYALKQTSHETSYCKIVHADDLLMPRCLERMIDVAQKHPSVAIVGAFRLAGNRVDLDGVVPFGTSVVSGREICRHSLLGGRYVFGSPTSLLLRASVVRGHEAFYNESHLHADTEACYEVLKTSDFGFVHEILTYTRRHGESITSAARRQGTWLPDQIAMLLKYGPLYLTDEELDGRLRQMLRRYNRWLARSTIRGRPFRDKSFAARHRRMLAEISDGLGQLTTRRGLSLRLWQGVLAGSAPLADILAK